MSKFLCLAIFIWLLLPSKVSAHQFSTVNNKEVFQTDNFIYRLRDPNKPWQLIYLPTGTGVVSSQTFMDKLFTVLIENGKKQLYVSKDGLLFNPIKQFNSSDQIVTKSVDDSLFVFTNDGIWISKDAQNFTKISSNQTFSEEDFSTINEIEGHISIAKVINNQATIYQNENNQWIMKYTLSCGNSIFYSEPFWSLVCNDKVYRLLPSKQEELFSGSLISSASSEPLLAIVTEENSQNRVIIWSGTSRTDVTVANIAKILNLDIIGNRIFIITNGQGIWELDWHQGTLSQASVNSNSSLFAIQDAQDQLLLKSDTDTYYSQSISSWQKTSMEGIFNHALKVPSGYLIYQTDEALKTGGITQFSSDAVNFHKVNPWATTTSPIQAILIGDNESYVSVITNSGQGNDNLYRTNDFIKWTRITMPEKTTREVDISTARNFTAGELVQTTGSLTVIPGVVSSDIIYLQDSLSGIQVYLSSSKGNLPTKLNYSALITGEISSSQTKRIILDEVDDIQTENQWQLSRPTISPSEIDQYQGRVVNLSGTVSVITSSEMKITDLSKEVKIHITGLIEKPSEKYSLNDELLIPSLIDFNGQTSNIEAWPLNSDWQILKKSNPLISLSNASTSQVASKKTSKDDSSQIVNTSALTKIQPNIGANNQKPIIEASENKSDNLQISLLSLASMAGGLIVARGKRFSRLVDKTS